MAECTHKAGIIASLEAAVEKHLATIAECESRIREDEMRRRMLHNTIQELKGEQERGGRCVCVRKYIVMIHCPSFVQPFL